MPKEQNQNAAEMSRSQQQNQQRQENQQLSRNREGGGGLARSGQMESYFPSPAEFFSNPFSAMRRMHEDMDRMFSQAFGGFGGGLSSAGAGGGAGGGLSMWSPAIEVRQDKDRLTVCAELPGLKPEEVQVEVNEDALVIQGERRQEERSDERGMHRTERRYGRFYRAIPLPDGANAEQAKAEFNHGVLEVTIPVPEQQSRRRQIPIGGTGSGAQGSQKS